MVLGLSLHQGTMPFGGQLSKRPAGTSVLPPCGRSESGAAWFAMTEPHAVQSTGVIPTSSTVASAPESWDGAGAL